MNNKQLQEIKEKLKLINPNLNIEVKKGKVNINYGRTTLFHTNDQDDIDLPNEEVIINEIKYSIELE